MPAVVRSVEIEAPPSTVWRWMASQEGLRQWLSPGMEIDLRVGGFYRFRDGEGDTWISGTVLDIVPEGGLTLSWMEEGSDWVYPARLVLGLAPTVHGTRVTLSHDGFAGIGKASWADTLRAYERGADRHRVLERLAELVAGNAQHQ